MKEGIKYDNQGDALSRDVPAEALALIDEGGNGAERRYSYGDLMRLSGALAVAALERSLSELVRRHEALRTRFVARGGEPLQVVGEAERVELPVTDLSVIRDEEEREAEAVRRCTEEARRPFDLARGPLPRY